MVKLQTLCYSYLAANPDLADRTKQTTERACRYLAELAPGVMIDNLRFGDIESYRNWLFTTGRSKNTANMYLRALSPVFVWAVKHKLMPANPIVGVRKFKVTQRPIHLYDSYEVERMLRYAPNDIWRGRLLIARCCGLRRGEVLNLTLDNIRDGFVYIEPKRETSRTWAWEPKDREIRKVPTVTALTGWLQAAPRCYYPFLKPQRYAKIMQLKLAGVLSNEVRRCPDPNFRRDFTRLQRRAFGRQIGTYHELRKTYITHMLNHMPDYFVCKLSGHSDVRTMVTYYTASRESQYAEARKVASAAINKDFGLVYGPAQSPGQAEVA